MCDLIISETQKQAIDYVVNVANQRAKIAKQVREMRAEFFAKGEGRRACFIGQKVVKMLEPLPKVTMAWIDREIAYSNDIIANAVCPDYTDDSGYSYCGLEDAWYESLENQTQWLAVAKEIKKLL